jgi:hypothetical protein
MLGLSWLQKKCKKVKEIESSSPAFPDIYYPELRLQYLGSIDFSVFGNFPTKESFSVFGKHRVKMLNINLVSVLLFWHQSRD